LRLVTALLGLALLTGYGKNYQRRAVKEEPTSAVSSSAAGAIRVDMGDNTSGVIETAMADAVA
jgi:hypothetical protein